ncbi:MAG TPA: hypothetical protein VHH72_10390 [Solirubrobacterales bacterium]|jgi:hypothetical protein|nr:hypothetical protein [Solirubrobacterales bacterium]
MDEALPIIFLAVVLKIPVLGMLWLIWWAIRAEPELEDAGEGGTEHGFMRWRRVPRGPRPRRGGPHGGAAPAAADCPPGGRKRVHAPVRGIPALAGQERRQHVPRGG